MQHQEYDKKTNSYIYTGQNLLRKHARRNAKLTVMNNKDRMNLTDCDKCIDTVKAWTWTARRHLYYYMDSFGVWFLVFSETPSLKPKRGLDYEHEHEEATF